MLLVTALISFFIWFGSDAVLVTISLSYPSPTIQYSTKHLLTAPIRIGSMEHGAFGVPGMGAGQASCACL